MGMPKRWSYSSISGWSDQCQRKWVATRINKVDDPTSKEAARGLVCHTALENLVSLPKSMRRLEVLMNFGEQELEAAKDRWPELYDNGFVRAVNNRLQTAFRLENFNTVPGTYIERELTATTPKGRDVIGFCDRADVLGDRVYLSDYKSGKASPYAYDSVRKQLTLYAWMWQQMEGVDAELISGRAIYLGGTGAIKVVSITQEDIDAIAAWADESIDSCLAQVNEDTQWLDVPASSSPLCGWCPLKDICEDSSKR